MHLRIITLVLLCAAVSACLVTPGPQRSTPPRSSPVATRPPPREPGPPPHRHEPRPPRHEPPPPRHEPTPEPAPAPEPAGELPPEAATVSKAPFDSRGWILLGEHIVDSRHTVDKFDFSQKRGKVTKLMVAVLDGELQAHRFRQQLVSGGYHETTMTHHFRQNARTRSLPIPEGKILRALWMEFHPIPRGTRTRVQVWAQ